MRIIGKLIVIFTGVVLSMSLILLLFVVISFETSPIVYSLLAVFVMYIVGLLSSILASRQRLLFVSLTAFTAYFTYDVGLVRLYQEPSQYTLTIALIVLMLVGMFLSRKSKDKSNIKTS